MSRKYRALVEALPDEVSASGERGYTYVRHIRWFAYREIAWQEEVIVIVGPCARCGGHDTLTVLDRQLVCTGHCLATAEWSVARIMRQN